MQLTPAPIRGGCAVLWAEGANGFAEAVRAVTAGITEEGCQVWGIVSFGRGAGLRVQSGLGVGAELGVNRGLLKMRWCLRTRTKGCPCGDPHEFTHCSFQFIQL